MKNRKNILLTGVAILLFAACKKYETYPVEQVRIDRVFDSRDSNGTKAYEYLNNVYAVLKNGHNRVNGDYLDAASDDAVSSASGAGNVVTQISTGSYNSGTFSSDLTGSNDNLWAYYYGGIRKANIFITNIDIVPTMAQIPGMPGVPIKAAWKNEARFLRAYFYFELVRRYGGVPLVGDRVFEFGDDVRLKRNTFEECINYIVSECDGIKDTLLKAPLPNANYGRVSNGAALALKARVLLYAASPLYNGQNIEPSNAYTGYTDGYKAERWKAAADAAKAVIDLGAYAIYDNGQVTSFRDQFLTQNNSEVIFARQGSNSVQVESANAPVGFPSAIAQGRTSPTQDLVNAFPMISGKAIDDPTSGYSSSNPYVNRDPRLTMSVFYNNLDWLGTKLKLYEGGQSKPNDGRQQTVSGYYMRKFMGASETVPLYTAHPTDWTMFRYAEVLLNYVEAQNEFGGPTVDLYLKLIELRKRARIQAGANNQYGLIATTNKDEFRKIIHNERRIELAFEEHRFFDIRRWKIAGDGEAVMNKPRNGVSVVNTFGNVSYDYIQILPAIYNPQGSFTSNQYFYPLPFNEVNANPNLEQNPGWN